MVAKLANELGSAFRHSILPLNSDDSARSRLRDSSSVDILSPPRRHGARFILALAGSINLASPDLVLTYNWGAIEAVLAAKIANICPVVHNEHGFGSDEAKTLKVRRILTRRVLLNTIPKTVVVSKTLEGIALDVYRIRPNRLTFIPNGVDTARFAPRQNAALRKELRIGENEVVFGYVGGLRAEKNLEFLLKAFSLAKIPSARLLIIGDGPLRDSLKIAVAHLHLQDCVQFVGNVDSVASWYNVMDVFVMSSSTEQAPTALLEAMASGLPAICTSAGDTRTMLGLRSLDFVTPSDDVDGYTKLLRSIAMQKDKRTEIGCDNRARCMRFYSQDRMISTYRDLYLQTISSGNQGCRARISSRCV